MNLVNGKTQLFLKKYPRHTIFSKILRHFLESQLTRLSQTHARRRRQLAIFAHDYISTQIILDGLYEVDELELLTQWLNSLQSNNIFSGMAVDVGANIGNHSLYFSDFFSEVLAFEPHPLTFKILSINTADACNVKCMNCGLSSSEGTAALVIDGRNMSGARVEQKSYDASTIILLRSLDSVLSEISGMPVRLMKIDVEGHESEVLAGAEETIREHQPIILFEQHVSDFYDGTSRVIELIRSYGYHNFACVERFPSIPTQLPDLLRLVFTLVARLLLGSSSRIVSVNIFKPQFQPFLIAIPSWLLAEVNSANVTACKS